MKRLCTVIVILRFCSGSDRIYIVDTLTVLRVRHIGTETAPFATEIAGMGGVDASGTLTQNSRITITRQPYADRLPHPTQYNYPGAPVSKSIVDWDKPENRGDREVARGVYFIRAAGPGIDEIRKAMVVK
ncbi:MAG: hypothetical protein LBD78_09400 [Spirochaetaceae bacterium]|jgi:hypothetical protein|nr:hypothetical protein [Spirochaetaceae bacterium]